MDFVWSGSIMKFSLINHEALSGSIEYLSVCRNYGAVAGQFFFFVSCCRSHFQAIGSPPLNH